MILETLVLIFIVFRIYLKWAVARPSSLIAITPIFPIRSKKKK